MNIRGSVVEELLKDNRIYDYMEHLKEHDIKTYQHSLNVTDLVSKMLEYPTVKKMFSQEEQQEIVIGALLHDIGKLQVDTKILNKKDSLTEQEFTQIKEHPVKGYRMAKENGFSEYICEIILYHHERKDGSGYPKHKKDLLKAVELVYTADMYCAMTEKRAYREPTSERSTINIMYYDMENGNISKDMYEMLIECEKMKIIQCG